MNTRFKQLHRYIFLSLLAVVGHAGAVTLDEAKEMYLQGDFAGALPVFQEALASKPKDASLNHWVGVCLMQEGRDDEALPHLKLADTKGIVEAPRYLAEMAFRNYDFEGAESYVERYEKALKKARKTMPEGAEVMIERIGLAKAMLDRVERIVIIDSVTVDKEEFFKAYRLTPESGSLNTADVLPEGMEAAYPTVVYMPETRTSMTWAAPDSLENYVLVSSNQLFDGSWETPTPLGVALSDSGDCNFPFFMSDGVTLYYANDGDESIGGYDIFISRKGEDGFLQPQNIGMPYNSPYDDYMLAIDEVTGVGWWATDRNRLGDMITIYKFIPSDLRNNYLVDEEGLADKARITDYRATWEEGKDYSDLLEAINEIDPDKKVKVEDFRFALPGGRIYTSWDDFKSPRAKELMEQYVESDKNFADKLSKLARLRDNYRNGNTEASAAILKLEKQVDADRTTLRKLANEVIKAEN